ncbi:MAG: hypothetical protein Q8L89_08900 [Gammaproteobacteria bacterium]|nr:hypothetical protein [Gammaproteobacteria bacterium]
MTVTLIYFRTCPNASLARARLLQAFTLAGLTPHWQEWARDDPASPAFTQGYGSPTVLVNGRDVTGAPPGDAASACRVYAATAGTFEGAPTVDVITTALREGRATEASTARTSWRDASVALPAIGAAALPKLTCPACWPAYSGLLGTMGVGFVNYTPYLLPLTAVFLLLSLMVLGWRAQQRRGYYPLFAGLVASLVLLIGKFTFDSDIAMFAGMGLLVAASLWNAWPRTRSAAGSCPACVSSSAQP